jgi:lipid-binding SYLF domain-containing protein
VLGELIGIPGREIPQRLLSAAQGVAVIPNVIKVGFVAGVRRGHGVVMVRDAQGQWTLPLFITLTGGSLGWQAGIQGTDVVLVFTTRKGVDGLLRGKCTIGVDASATAGPVGRNAAAATDTELKAEIFSYSRSRGLFLGASFDGSLLEIDQVAAANFYGPPPAAGVPQRVPESATKLHNYLVDLTKPATVPPPQLMPVAPR